MRPWVEARKDAATAGAWWLQEGDWQRGACLCAGSEGETAGVAPGLWRTWEILQLSPDLEARTSGVAGLKDRVDSGLMVLKPQWDTQTDTLSQLETQLGVWEQSHGWGTELGSAHSPWGQGWA